MIKIKKLPNLKNHLADARDNYAPEKGKYLLFLGWVLLLLPQILGAAANQGPTQNQPPNNNQPIKIAGPTQINPTNPTARRQLMLQLLTRIILHRTNDTTQLFDIITQHGPGPDNYNFNHLYSEIYRIGLLRRQLQTLRDHAQLTPNEIEEFITRYRDALQQYE